MSDWNGEERRVMEVHECSQMDRLARIESMCQDSNLRLAVIDERLKSLMQLYDTRLEKYDDHVKDGELWHRAILGIALSLGLSVAGGIWWGATLQRDTDRLMGLHPFGTAVEPTHRTNSNE